MLRKCRNVLLLVALTSAVAVTACSTSNASPNDPAILMCVALERGMHSELGSPTLSSYRIDGQTAHISVTYADAVGITETKDRDCLFEYSESDGGFFLAQPDFVSRIDLAPIDLDALSTEQKQQLLDETNQKKARTQDYLGEMSVMLQIMTSTHAFIPPDQTQLSR